jgi:hypothetical protein
MDVIVMNKGRVGYIGVPEAISKVLKGFFRTQTKGQRIVADTHSVWYDTFRSVKRSRYFYHGTLLIKDNVILCCAIKLPYLSFYPIRSGKEIKLLTHFSSVSRRQEFGKKIINLFTKSFQSSELSSQTISGRWFFS